MDSMTIPLLKKTVVVVLVISLLVSMSLHSTIDAYEPVLGLVYVDIFQHSGASENKLLVNEEVFVQGRFKSLAAEDEKIAITYIVLIKDHNDFTVNLTWTEKVLTKDDLTASISWIPEKTGNYTAELYTWSSLETPVPIVAEPTALIMNVISKKTSNDALENYRFVTGFGGSAWSAPAIEDGGFVLPNTITADNQGFVYVADETRIQQFTFGGTFIKKWGSYCDIYTKERCVDLDGPGPLELGDGQFINPYVTTDKVGNVYALEFNGGVQKFDSQGEFLGKWNVTHSVGKSFNGRAIAVDQEGFVYLGDTVTNQILKFTNDGMFYDSYGGECILEVHENKGYGIDPCKDPDGSGPLEVGDGQFTAMSDIAFDSQGFMYVADSANYRIQKLANDGKFVTKWGSKCLFANPPGTDSGCKDPDLNGPLQKGDGQFHNPISVAVSNEGFVYVADFDGHNIQKFTLDGKFLTKWGGYCFFAISEGCIDPDNDGPLELGDEQFLAPAGIATDPAGFVYVVERTNERVQKFTSDGKFVTKWGKPKSFDGLLSFPRALAVDKDGNVYVAGGNYNRIQKFASDGRFLMKWGFGGSKPGELMFPTGIAVSNDGYVYVADTENHRIQKFTNAGKFVSTWNSFGFEKIYYPSSIAVDVVGIVYVFDATSSSVLKFDSDGRLLTRWGSFCTLYGIEAANISQFTTPAIPAGTGCVDPDGNGPLQFGDAQFMSGRIAIDPNGYVYVSDVGNNRTQKFTLNGKLVDKFDYFGIIAADEEGNIYVAYADAGYIKKFDGNGNMLANIRLKQFEGIESIAVDQSENIYILDGRMDIIQKYSPITR